MSMPTQDLQDLSMGVFTPSALDPNFPSTDGTLSIPQLSDNVDPLPPPIREPIDSTSYSESDYDWLVNVLEALIKFIHRDENWSIPELEENDYAWAHALLVELVGAVGESETHPLRPLMEFVRQLIDNYEDKYVPELTELFPELAEEAPIETANESKQPASDIPKQSENELAAHAFFSIGYLLSKGSRMEKALAAYDKAIELKPDFVEAYNNRGGVFQKLGKYDQAVADLGKAIDLYPDFAELYCNRGCLKGSSGELKAAATDFNKRIELDPKNAKAYYHSGITKNQLGEYQAALIDFDKAVELGLNSVNVYYYRALAKTLLNRYDAAISDYDKVIELNPDHAEAYNSRGNLRGSLGQYDDALADCTKAIRLKSDYAEAYVNRGMTKVKLGCIDEAITDFQKALELAEQQDYAKLKNFVEEGLQQLEQEASKQKNHKIPRRSGQWKGQVKISEDFDELPESFMACFDREDE